MEAAKKTYLCATGPLARVSFGAAWLRFLLRWRTTSLRPLKGHNKIASRRGACHRLEMERWGWRRGRFGESPWGEVMALMGVVEVVEGGVSGEGG